MSSQTGITFKNVCEDIHLSPEMANIGVVGLNAFVRLLDAVLLYNESINRKLPIQRIQFCPTRPYFLLTKRAINIESNWHAICTQSDQVAFKTLFDHFYPRLLHFSFSLIRNSELAEEIVLDVFSAVWHKRETLSEVAQIGSYLFTATKNRTLNAVRDGKKDLVHLEVDSIDFRYIRNNNNPESELLSSELFTKINDAIDALPEKGRIIYRMVKEEGMNYKEVAELLDISTKTVDSHLYTAVKKIRLAVEEYYYDQGQHPSKMTVLAVLPLILPDVLCNWQQPF